MKEWLWAHAKILIGILISTLLVKSGGIIGKIFGTLGLAFISYHYVMPEIRTFLAGYFSGLSGEVYNLVTYLNIDKGMTLVLSAGAMKLSQKLMFGQSTPAS